MVLLTDFWPLKLEGAPTQFYKVQLSTKYETTENASLSSRR